MKLVPYAYEKLKKERVTRSNNYKILEEFANSGEKCAKVEDFTQKTAGICASSLKNSIKRYRRFDIEVVLRKNEVFLVRKLLK